MPQVKSLGLDEQQVVCPRKPYTVDIVVPCYEESAALPSTVPTLLAFMRERLRDERLRLTSFRLILVDDGSKDATWSVIQSLSNTNPEIVGVKLSRNFGHQNALLAGLSFASADASISIDADLQDDIATISDMLIAYQNGYDFVLGVRSDRAADTVFKRTTAGFYYWLLTALGAPVIRHHADFRLMSRRAVNALLSHSEVNLFLRGIVPTIGFPVAIIPFTRNSRTLGTSKYPILKMISLALQGITSFSVVPLRLVALTGALVFVISGLLGFYTLMIRIFEPQRAVPGWASTMLPLLFLGGMQILSIGVLGEYVGKIYLEVKRRPRFLIEDTIGKNSPNLQNSQSCP